MLAPAAVINVKTARVPFGQVEQRAAAGGDRKRRPAGRIEITQLRHDRLWRPYQLRLIDVDPLGDQRALPYVNQHIRLDQLETGIDRDQRLRWPSRLEQHQGGIVVFLAQLVEQPFAIGQENRPTDAGLLLRRIGLEQQLGIAAGRRNPHQHLALYRREHDFALTAPAAGIPDARIDVAQDDRRAAAFEVQAFELAVAKKGQGLTVGRPENRADPFGPHQRRRFLGAQRPQVHPPGRRFVAADKSQRAAIGRNRQLPAFEVLRDLDPRRRRNLETHRRPWTRRRSAEKNQGERRQQQPRHQTTAEVTQPQPPQTPRRGGFRRQGETVRPRRQRGELEHQVVRALPALLGVFGQAETDQPLEPGRHLRTLGHQRIRAHHRGDHRGQIFARIRALAGDHLEQHTTQRPQIAAGIGFPALELLRRHELRRAYHHAVEGQGLTAGQHRFAVERPCQRARRQAHLQLGQTKIEQLDPRAGQDHVAGFQIPVHDAVAVGLVERLGDLAAVTQRLLERQLAARQTYGERLPFEVLHHQVVAFAVPPDVEEGADVGMLQRRDGPRFPFEAAAQLGVFGKGGGEDLDGHGPTKARIASLVDLSHATFTELGGDLVRTKPAAGRQCHDQFAAVGGPGRPPRKSESGVSQMYGSILPILY